MSMTNAPLSFVAVKIIEVNLLFLLSLEL